MTSTTPPASSTGGAAASAVPAAPAPPVVPAAPAAPVGLAPAAADRDVVAEVAGVATRGVLGVHDVTGDVSVELTGSGAVVAVTVVADYPMPLDQVAVSVRSAVVDAVASLAGLCVTRVDVTIDDLVVPAQDELEPTAG